MSLQFSPAASSAHSSPRAISDYGSEIDSESDGEDELRCFTPDLLQRERNSIVMPIKSPDTVSPKMNNNHNIANQAQHADQRCASPSHASKVDAISTDPSVSVEVRIAAQEKEDVLAFIHEKEQDADWRYESPSKQVRKHGGHQSNCNTVYCA